MHLFLPPSLRALAEACPFPLYLVGGSVRDALCGFAPSGQTDWDICAAADEDALLAAAERAGFSARAVYRRTGTVNLTDGHIGCEFTRFRSDKYVRGVHAPAEVTFTEDIAVDARRRDFTCNAVYYDIAADKICDPLGGCGDIAAGILRTVAPAQKVFGEDGLRLMRLCRFAAQLGFSPDEDCLKGAAAHHALIRDISPERIFKELSLLLHADEKRGDREGPYKGLHLMRDTGVLGEVFPELALGHGMAQRSDFHRYDVLEHSLRCVRYAPPEIRFAALLHDVGKPFCFLRDGNFYAHAEEGARLTENILTRLKAPVKLTRETAELVRLHMRDLDLRMKEPKVRRDLAAIGPLLPKLFALKQADYSACKDDTSPAPTVVKWERILRKMQREGAPFSLAELKIDGNDLKRLGIPPRLIGSVLARLFDECVLDGAKNRPAALGERARSIAERLQEREAGPQ